MATVTREQLEAAIGPRAEYYLRRFEKIDSGRRAGWNWPAFFLSTAWFSYRGMGGWAALNLIAPWLALILALTDPFSAILGVPILVAYPVVFFVLVPMYADALYYQRAQKEVARLAAGSKPSSPTSLFSAIVVGLVAILLPALLAMIVLPANMGYASRSQMSEAISLMGGGQDAHCRVFRRQGQVAG